MTSDLTVSFPSIQGYRVSERLHQGHHTAVYRAFSETRQQPVVLKVLHSASPSFRELVKFRNQYTLTKNLSINGIVKPLGFEQWKNSNVLVMEDHGALSLKLYCRQQKLDCLRVLKLAIQLADILHHLAQTRIIHKDIKPANILIHPDTHQIRLIDFSIASLLPKERQELQSPGDLEGTLAYLAPEQTGRMNRGVDYRADFYGFGVTLYELLTGRLPFFTDDLMELVHFHLAKVPCPPHEVNPDIPMQVSDIVLKLMAKNAEDRYQSALGLKHDLELCLEQLNEQDKIEFFELGQRDVCDRFLIPEQLYGREAEVTSLLNAFERVAQGSSELMLVAGSSGIGKTAVVNEVHKPITRQKGYFIQGKFDQFNRDIPFSAFVQAFRRLMAQLLGESDTELERWKAKILQAAGDSGQVLIEVIPELELILGAQPVVPELLGSAAQNRFNILFSKFIQVFTTLDHPLVIFLDDLQWADSGSLNLLKLLMGEAATGYLLVIGAYRDNEVFPAHPLMRIFEAIEEKRSRVDTLTLKALKLNDLEQMVASSMLCSTAIVASLAKLIYQKTQGNPFFSIQFLRGLHEDGHISFTESSHWQCDLEQVRRLALTDDVVTLMVKRLRKLPQTTQDVLKQAACIGNRFDLTTLAAVCDSTQDDVAAELWPALQIGLVLPEGDAYKLFQKGEQNVEPQSISVVYRFLHDRVQQAVYSLIPDSQKQVTHYCIGQQMLGNLSAQQREEKFFEIINQLNYGLSLISDPVERRNLAQFNLEVGKKAKASTAYDAANNYFSAARRLLENDSWATEYSLTLEIYQESVEAAYLRTEFQQSKQLADHALQHTAPLLDQIKIHVIRIQSYIAQSNLHEAIHLALTVLKLLDDDIELPAEPDQDDCKRALAEIQLHMADHSIDGLAHLPEMSDPEKLAAMQILASVAPPCYVAFPSMMPLIAMQMVKLSLIYGNAPSSAFGYAMYGFLLCGVVSDIEAGYQFGQLSLALVNHSNAKEIQSKVFLLLSHFIQLWKKSIHQCIQLSLDAFRYGLDSGDFEFAGYAASFYCFDAIFVGKNLDSLCDEIQAYKDIFIQYKQEYGLARLYLSQQVFLNLTQKLEHPYNLIGDSFNENEMLPMLQHQNDRTSLAMVYVAKLMLCYTFHEYECAIAAAAKAEEYLDGVVAMLCVALFHFYDSLVKLAVFEREDEVTRTALLLQVQQNQEKLRYWADHAPANYLHKVYLVDAEYERVVGNKAAALENYDLAISIAQENQYLQEEALANELAALFYLNWGKASIASDYIQKSYSCYSRWGAQAKAEHLFNEYSQLLKPLLQDTLPVLTSLETLANISTTSVTPSTHSSIRGHTSLSQALDFATVIQSAQALSSSLELDLLILQLMQLMMQSSGAESCALILPALPDNPESGADSSRTDDWEVHRLSSHGEPVDVPGNPSMHELFLPDPQKLTDCCDVPRSLIHYAKRTGEIIQHDRLSQEDFHITDKYLIDHQPQSVLVQPILHQGDVIGVLYLENRLTAKVFNPTQQTVIDFFCNQAGIALENAKLYQKQASHAQALETKNHQLESAKQAAEAANRAKSNFLNNISHELRTPLNGILGYTQILQRSQTLAQKDLHGIKIIHQCGTHLLTLINDVLDVSKIEARKLELSPTAIHLPSLLQGVIDMCRVKVALKDVDLIYHPCSRLPDGVFADAKRLRQVLINLLGNAIKFTDHGSVTLQVKVLSIDHSKHTLLFQVIDTGVGIEPEDCDQLFQAFEQVGDLSKQAEGTGLGLTISQQIVQVMGSSIQVKSQPGQGSEFFFTLDFPLTEDWALQQCSSNADQRITGYQGKRRHILIVDDHWENRVVLSNLLEPLGFSVMETDNGKVGLEQLHRNRFDLLILDVAMPMMDGFEVLKEIRYSESLSHLKIIVSSGSVSPIDSKCLQEAGGHAFLDKPINSNDLLQVLAEQLDLRWNYDTVSVCQYSSNAENIADHVEVVLPPAVQLRALQELAACGMVRSLRQQLEQLIDQEPQYMAFARPLLSLSQQFKVEEIEGILAEYLCSSEVME